MASRDDPLTEDERRSIIENTAPIPVGTIVRLTRLGHKYYDAGDGFHPRGRMIRGRVVDNRPGLRGGTNTYVEVLEPLGYFETSTLIFHAGALTSDEYKISELPNVG